MNTGTGATAGRNPFPIRSEQMHRNHEFADQFWKSIKSDMSTMLGTSAHRLIRPGP